MYLHIGQNEIIPERRIIGIFDLDKCSHHFWFNFTLWKNWFTYY